jgi:hypothetical protein
MTPRGEQYCQVANTACGSVGSAMVTAAVKLLARRTSIC